MEKSLHESQQETLTVATAISLRLDPLGALVPVLFDARVLPGCLIDWHAVTQVCWGTKSG
eukprot:51158-Pyramimonas_sp.AAC.1